MATATYSRLLLSGSTNGKPIKVAANATPGTTLHTAISGSSGFDELYLWVANTSSADVALTIEWGGVTDPDNLLCKAVTIPANSPPIPIATGMVLNNGAVAAAFASAANVLTVTGYVNRISAV